MATELELQKKYKKHADKIAKQSQEKQPGKQWKMKPEPLTAGEDYSAAGKLKGQVALITGGDSGIGQAVATLFAKEGADVAIVYLPEEERDAEKTELQVTAAGRKCLRIALDLTKPENCQEAVARTMKEFKRLDVLVNNAAFQTSADDLEDVSDEQFDRTMKTNVYSAFYITKAALEKMKDGSRIIFTNSVVAYRGSKGLIDYSTTKGALTTMMRSLSTNLAPRQIRVNAVAPGPIWTPFIPPAFDPEKIVKFGEDQPLGRAGQPEECAPAYVFLASTDSTYISGQTIHVNGGEVVGG